MSDFIVEKLSKSVGDKTVFRDISFIIHDKKEIQINGGILIKEYGYQPGPDLGEILTEIEFAIVDGELENNREAIHAYLREKK
ncbi:tRNA nucleotidyltransferase [Streptococcus pneumoniae]|uniref:hypothetical protein n=1 Tax=Streptococcus pneumoniae TaxID=1313 RepID=UPI0005E7F740|nr:tRNA nucleotidyltransferase [Streptococcus pneumoniae]COF24757.1 tRNA nucleotidyltransferase [Streptococcus pneumoniae]COJ31264.1 tRNA nucleotidyltransferase [Streptococcus pneumoniae]